MKLCRYFINLVILNGLALADPDIICGSLEDVNNYGIIDGIRAYSVGTTACNIGDSNADWIAGTPNHPVIGATIWKYDHETSRLTQLGVSHVMHEFFALQTSVCQPCFIQPGGDHLGAGCSAPIGANLNGLQGRLGPRTEVNPFTGFFPYPFTGFNQDGNAIFKRIQVQQSDITDSTATFYVEGVYTIKDDYDAGTNFNNASYKQLDINQKSFNATTVGSTMREVPAIYAWQSHDASVVITEAEWPGEGRIIVASKATDMGGGTWRYDYGVYNQNSHLAVASFSVPMSTVGANHGFNDITYRDIVDENVDGTDWAPVDGGSGISWNTTTHSAGNQWGNAVRWGTMYNFWFETDAPPTNGDTTVGSFIGGHTMAIAGVVPTTAAGCPADFTGDGELDFFDVSAFLAAFGSGDPSADFTGEGDYDFFDVSAFLTAFSNGCP